MPGDGWWCASLTLVDYDSPYLLVDQLRLLERFPDEIDHRCHRLSGQSISSISPAEAQIARIEILSRE